MKRLFLLNIGLLVCGLSFSQIITTVAGNGIKGYFGNGGPATAAELWYPGAMCIDSGNGYLIVDEFNHVLRKVTGAGIITAIAGIGVPGYSGDGGMATGAELNYPTGVCKDTSGNIYIADYMNNVIRKVSSSGIITTIAGKDSGGYSGDGGQATAAKLNGPYALAADKSGNIYITDYKNSVVRKVSSSGIITTIVGNGAYFYSGDGGPATDAELSYPGGICLDNAGNIYVADVMNDVIRKISVAGIITTIAGNRIHGYAGDGGMATNAELSWPYGVCIDTLGNIYIGDYDNNRVRKISPSGIISTVAGNGIAGYSGDNGLAIAAELNGPVGVCINDSGNLLIADYTNSVVRKISKPWLAGEKELMGNNQELFLYPNPNNGRFTIELQGVGDKEQVEIYNIMGEKIYSQTLNTKHLTLNIDLPCKSPGVYLYRVLGETGELVGEGKFVIQK